MWTYLFRFLFLTVSPNLKYLRLKTRTEKFCSVRSRKISSRLGPSHEKRPGPQPQVCSVCLLQLPDAVAERTFKGGPSPSRCRYREKNPRDSEEVASNSRHGSDPSISARGVRTGDQEAGAGEARFLGLGRRRAALRREDQVLQQRQLQDHEEGRRSLWEGVSVSSLRGSVEILHRERFPGSRISICWPNHFYIELGCVIPAKPTCAAFTQPCGSLHILCTSSWRNISSMFSS